MNVLAYFCSCIGSHEPNCPLLLRLQIKEQVCRAHGIVSDIPEDVAQEIDDRVAQALQARSGGLLVKHP